MAWIRTPEALAKLPKLLYWGRYSYTYDEIPLIAEGLSFRKRINLIRAGLDLALCSEYANALPPTIHIEPTNICNLKCSLCPTGSGSLKRPKGFMSFDMFQTVLNELGDVLLSVILFAFGEPFLNKELPRMIKECTDRNILTLSSTNGHCLQTLDEALSIVDAGLSALIIAMDGSTQGIYQAYRKSGDVEMVKRCVAHIEQAKAMRGSDLPYTNLRVVVTRNNEEDLPNIERVARDLGVNMFSCKSLGCLAYDKKYKSYEPDKREMRRFNNQSSPRRSKAPIQCPFPFRQPTIYWDGTVVGCGCASGYANLETPFGKIGEHSFRELWNSTKAMELRRAIRTGLNLPKFCHFCPYQGRSKDTSVISYKELRSV